MKYRLKKELPRGVKNGVYTEYNGKAKRDFDGVILPYHPANWPDYFEEISEGVKVEIKRCGTTQNGDPKIVIYGLPDNNITKGIKQLIEQALNPHEQKEPVAINWKMWLGQRMFDYMKTLKLSAKEDRTERSDILVDFIDSLEFPPASEWIQPSGNPEQFSIPALRGLVAFARKRWPCMPSKSWYSSDVIVDAWIEERKK